MKTLGIIGGLGPMATVYLMELITQMTAANTDQDHINSIVFNCPEIPDRTAYILDRSKPSPLPEMIEIAKKLQALGADVIATPCNTAHYFYDDIAGAVDVPIINVLSETARVLKDSGVRNAGIMATTGTVSTRLFQNEFERHGISCILPDDDDQALVMSVIYDDIKAGRAPDMEKFNGVSDRLFSRKCDCVVLGCTELSLIKRSNVLGPGFLDTLEVIAKRCVEACGKQVVTRYRSLITE